MSKTEREKGTERIFMNEFLLLALVIVYMAISYRSTSREAQGDKQNHHNKQASYEARGVDDH